MSTKKKTTAAEVMVVNDSPGEECRIAILQDNHLEELFSERTATATNVGNIYKARVTNVEPAIQAAFVDYGEGQAGFLHISDLHPQYFPGAKRTERVGKKIPRRSRPPIQEALRRGDEVLVQVLKEGIGSKGPTLTSYLSVPGRLLVMMPEMDRVGVSRKLEDPDERRKMRETLDQLKLPEGFGFILRTAGFGETKAELTRDVAYLTRLWKVMEKRIKDVGAPCELYTESDLFGRTIRDILRPTIEAIVVDSEPLYERAKALLRVVAPRSSPRLIRYRGSAPIFHAFDIERQIELIHGREVPLPSGGKLVLDQTEALVAIDVNSGRSRRARDSETNAFQTNREAVDEICRQLRLRDLGGLVINDLIDMHAFSHRREIEDRFREGLARDRARTTMLRISEFGIVELTRQRMRPSLRKTHYMNCSHCDGHGEIRAPDSVGSDATRQAGYLLQFDRVRRLEIVCSPRVASVLLSSKRRELVHMEDESRKKIDVRVSDAIAVDRVDFHAYDDRNADIDLTKLPVPKIPSLDELEAAPEPADGETTTRSTRKRRRRGSKPADAGALMLAAAADVIDDDEAEVEVEVEVEAEVEAEIKAEIKAETPDEQPKPAARRRRRRSRGRGGAAARAAKDRTDAEADKNVTVVEADKAIRVHELASELGVTSREVLTKCREDEVVEVKSHMSSISTRAADLMRKCFGLKRAPKKADAVQTAPEPRGELKTEPEVRATPEPAPEPVPEPSAEAAAGPAPEPAAEPAPEAEPTTKKRRSRRRRRRSSKKKEPTAAAAADGADAAAPVAPMTPVADDGAGNAGRKKRSRRRSGQRRKTPMETAGASVPAVTGTAASSGADARNGEHREPPKATATLEKPASSTRRAPRSGLYRSRRTVSRTGRPASEDQTDQ